MRSAPRTIYLDLAATTPLAAEVRAAMAPFLDEEWGNPSSRHARGVRVARALDGARAALARIGGVAPEGVVFTSGGTEANNLAVLGAARARRGRGRHVLIGPSEHACVRAPALALADEGFEVEVARHDASGALDLDDLAGRLRRDTVLVACMLACNEHGGVYPLRAIARLARERSPDAHVHTDAVQSFGKLDLDVEGLGVHSAAVSAHKIHGPKGAGALLLARGATVAPLLHGGGQERGLRSGTESPAGIAGLVRAAELADGRREETLEHLRALRAAFADELASGARGEGVELLSPGGADAALPSIAAVLLGPGHPPAEVLLHHLEERGVFASAGSACHAHAADASPALLSLGLSPEEVRRVLRFSFSRETTEDEVRAGARALREVALDLRERAGAGPRSPRA